MTPISDLRKEYSLQSLHKKDVALNAMDQFGRWWQDALKTEINEANAMTLATASADGLPSARIVLLKGFHKDGFQFYTNYESFKGRQIAENPRACLVFFWKELERQVRITGLVDKLNSQESDAYFNSRPIGSRIGALASSQSEVIESSAWLSSQAERLEEKYADLDIPRPPNWGGYLVKPVTIEFWQGRPNRLHDRLLYTLQEDGSWIIDRLAP
ncbi:MAG TPA: pyridoxamine 5'-phosphate oxidase [Puia sp.]|jgi:pyridoxamine 5'-phosphate oxidase|nr:pyridoxamine 5'-phosphate oxidase [Puia sp.]